MNEIKNAPGLGDTVRVYARSFRNDGHGGIIRSRVLQPGLFVIVGENRHGDWTVRDLQFDCTHDVFRDDVEFPEAGQS